MAKFNPEMEVVRFEAEDIMTASGSNPSASGPVFPTLNTVDDLTTWVANTGATWKGDVAIVGVYSPAQPSTPGFPPLPSPPATVYGYTDHGIDSITVPDYVDMNGNPQSGDWVHLCGGNGGLCTNPFEHFNFGSTN